MNRCPITYEVCEGKYSEKGLKMLSPNLSELKDFPYTPKEQVQLAAQFAAKISIQGVQSKLSIKLNTLKKEFEIVEKGGRYILKPPHQIYNEVCENEDVSMRLAKITHIETPFHCMIYNIDGSRSYIIQRFDRLAKGEKVGVEDFSQLLGFSRDTKYEASMEKIIPVIETHCTFPLIEKTKLFRRIIFNFLIGNEDMHLKNYTLIKRADKVELSPAYDFLNTSILFNATEEIALPIRGKKSRINRADLVDYFGVLRLGLSPSIMESELLKFKDVRHKWSELLKASFLSLKMQLAYEDLIEKRFRCIGLS